MKKVALFGLIATVLLASCGQGGFTNGKKGLKYKIIAGKEKDSLFKPGDFVQFAQVVKFGDSVVRNSYESGNEFNKIDSIDQPLSITEVIKKMRVGDSAMIKLSCDTIYNMQWEMAKQQNVTKEQFEQQMPKFITKKGNFISIGIKIVKKYTSDSLAMVDVKAQEPLRQAYQQKMQAKQMEEQTKKDAVGNKASKEAFDKFIAGKSATWKKTPSGAYVEIITEGTGEACATGKLAELRYIGRLMSNNNIFDTNVKGAKQGDTMSKPTLPVTVNAGGTVKGFDEGIAMLRKGTKAKLYIPAELGYAGQSPSPELPAYSNLIFDIEVVDVKNAPAQPKGGAGPQQQQQLTPEQMKQLQQQMQQQAGKQ